MFNLLRRVFGDHRIMDATVRRLEEADIPKTEKTKRLIQVLQTYDPFKLMQRLFALVIVFTYIGIWVICVVVFLGVWIKGGDVEPIKELALLNHQMLSFAFFSIVVLYFGGGVGEGLIERWKSEQSSPRSKDT